MRSLAPCCIRCLCNHPHAWVECSLTFFYSLCMPGKLEQKRALLLTPRTPDGPGQMRPGLLVRTTLSRISHSFGFWLLIYLKRHWRWFWSLLSSIMVCLFSLAAALVSWDICCPYCSCISLQFKISASLFWFEVGMAKNKQFACSLSQKLHIQPLMHVKNLLLGEFSWCTILCILYDLRNLS